MTDAERTREARLRRLAKRSGLILRQSRVQTTNIDDWNGYMLFDAHTGNVDAGTRWGLTLDDVERILTIEAQ